MLLLSLKGATSAKVYMITQHFTMCSMSDLKNQLTKTNLCTRMHRDQLLTVGDLEDFKKSLLEEIRSLFSTINNKSQPQWLKSKDARKILGGISAGKLHNLRITGALSCTKLGGTILFNYEDIVAYLSKVKSQNTNE